MPQGWDPRAAGKDGAVPMGSFETTLAQLRGTNCVAVDAVEFEEVPKDTVYAVGTLGDPLVCLLHATRSAFHTA